MSVKYKIGIILNAPPAYSETFFQNKILILERLGHDVKIFADSRSAGKDVNNNNKIYNGRVYYLSFFMLILLPYFFLKNPARIINLFRHNRDSGLRLKRNLISIYKNIHILSHELDWIYFGYAALTTDRENLALVMGAKMAVSVRGYDLSIYPLTRPMCYDLLWKRIDKLHYLSDNLLKLAKSQGFDSESVPSMKITPAIDIDRYEPYKKTKIESFKSKTGPIHFVTIARLHWIKGLDDTIQALSMLKEIDFHYTIVGDGSDYQRLLFLIKDLDLNGRVTLAGKRTTSEILSILSCSDIYIQYSEHEGFCNSALEAQCIGLPCIVSDGGALSENIVDNETGFVVLRRNTHALAQKIKQVVDMDESELNKISIQAMSRVRNEFSLSIQQSKFDEFYQ